MKKYKSNNLLYEECRLLLKVFKRYFRVFNLHVFYDCTTDCGDKTTEIHL